MKDLHSDNELDKMFSDGLEGFEMEPSGNVWENIEKRLDKKSRRPKFVLWLLAGIGVLITGTLLFYMLQPDHTGKKTPDSVKLAEKSALESGNMHPGLKRQATKEEHHENGTADPVINTTSATTNNTANTAVPAANTIALNEQKKTIAANEKTKSTKTEKQEKQTITHATAVPPTVNAANGNKKKHQASEPVHTDPVTVNSPVNNNTASSLKNGTTSSNPENKNVPENKNTPVANNNKKGTATNPVAVNSNTGKDPVVTAPEKNKSDVPVIKKPDNDPVINSNTPVTNNSTEPLITNPAKNQTDSVLKSNAVEVAAADTTAKSVADSSQAKKDPPAITAADSLKETIPPIDPFNPVAISTYFSPEYFMPKISSAQEMYSPGAETHNIRYSFGLKAEFRPVRLLGIQLGVAYSEISQQSSSQHIYFPKNLSTPYTFYGSLGEMQADPDVMKEGFSPMAPVSQYPLSYRYSQKVSFINVPVNVKLHFGKKKLGVTVLAGLNTQYALKQHSQLVLEKEHFNNVIDDNNIKVNRLNYSALIGVGAEYKLNKFLGVFVEPNVRYNVSDLSRQPGISNKPVIFGANTGVNFYFR